MDLNTRSKRTAQRKSARAHAGGASSGPTRSGKEEIGDARQEEDGREGQGKGGTGTRGSAQGRRGRRRQERLARLIAPWWERDPESLRAEVRGLEASGFRVLGQGLGLGHRLVLTVERGETQYELEYDEDVLSSRASVTAHSVSGQLQVRSDPIARGVQPGAALSALDQLVRRRGQYAPVGLPEHVIVPGQWRWPGVGERGSLTLGRGRSDGALAATRVTGVTEADRLSDAGFAFARVFPHAIAGLWVHGTSHSPSEAPAEAVVGWVEEQLARAHHLQIGELRERLRREVGAVMVQRAGSLSADWQFVRRSSSGAPIALLTRMHQAQGFLDRAPFAATLATKKVAIIGCGAVGWPVATLLARSGVRSFALFDDDTLHGGNLARIGAFLDSIGRLKIAVLAEQLEAIAPGVVAVARPHEGGLHVGAQALIEEQPDLLVNLTAEEYSTDETNLAACYLDCPAIFGWVSNSVLAARLFRVRPLETACYECVRQAGPARIPSYGLVPVGTETPWSGSVMNVDLFAAAVANMAVQTLIGAPTSAINPDHVVLRYGGPVPVASTITIARDPQCQVCRP